MKNLSAICAIALFTCNAHAFKPKAAASAPTPAPVQTPAPAPVPVQKPNPVSNPTPFSAASTQPQRNTDVAPRVVKAPSKKQVAERDQRILAPATVSQVLKPETDAKLQAAKATSVSAQSVMYLDTMSVIIANYNANTSSKKLMANEQ